MINAILDIQEEEPLYPYDYNEPVTVQEFKNYAKIDYDEDDVLISSLLTTSRKMLENYTNLSFILKRLTVQLNNGCGGIFLPGGPMPYTIDTSLITTFNGEAINDRLVLITGNQFKQLRTPAYEFLQLIYTAGYETLPEALKTAIKAQCFFLYNNRGDEIGQRNYTVSFIAEAARVIADNYKRVFDLTI